MQTTIKLKQKEDSKLKNTKLYKRLLEFEKRILQGKKYSRKDLGF